MTFTPNQIEELVGIIKFQHVLFGIESIGKDVVSNEDLDILRKHGVNPDKISIDGLTYLEQAFHFGRLASALGNYQTKKIKYQDFKKFVQGGGHRALSDHEKEMLKYIKIQTFQAVKNLGARVTGDAVKMVISEDAKARAKYVKILQDELAEGVRYRKTVAEITRELGKKTGDWTRDLGRLVETEYHNAYEEGRAAEYREKNGTDVLVYKDVYAGACKHCIKAYLTSGIGSPPKIFKLSELAVNGTNVGKKSDDWLPVIGALHPHCRCTINTFPEGSKWSSETRAFIMDKNYKQRYAYNVTITIGNNTYTI